MEKPGGGVRKIGFETDMTDFAIVGGGGFLGQRMAQIIIQSEPGATCHCLDVAFPSDPVHEHRITRVKVDLADPACTPTLVRSFDGVRCVFLVASFGMSGEESLQTRLIRRVNVDGAARVLKACLEAGVPSLVYCSTYNTVFHGQIIEGLSEDDLPYPDDASFVDEYSLTKSIAERMVLDANSEKLSTLSLRPAAIWGSQESRHMKRVNDLIDRKMFRFRFGDRPLVDFVHVNNLVLAHILAARKLEARDPNVAGRAFFVNDGKPHDNFAWFCRLKDAKGQGGEDTLFQVPYTVVYLLAIFFEIWYRLTGVWRPWMLTRAEVMKAGVRHHVRIDRARQHLGYEPTAYDFGEVIERWTSESHMDAQGEKKER